MTSALRGEKPPLKRSELKGVKKVGRKSGALLLMNF
jgi:hypothetical protein